MAEPEGIPAVTVWGVGRGIVSLIEEVPSSSSKLEQLRFKVDVPVCIIFQYEGGRNFFFDNSFASMSAVSC